MKQETVFIESPEKIRFYYKIAHTGTRIGAYILDIVIQGGIIILILLLFFSIGVLGDFLAGDFQFLALAFFYLVYFFLQWGYFTFFELFKNGQSPGKKILRIDVIKADGEPLDVSTIVLRNLLRAVDGFPFFHFLGGFISILDSKSRRLGDIVSDTLVVHEIRFDLEEPKFTTRLSSKSTAEPSMGLITKLDEEELYVIRRFLGERHLLSPVKQKNIAAKLAAGVKKRLNINDDSHDDIIFLEQIYREHSVGGEKRRREEAKRRRSEEKK